MPEAEVADVRLEIDTYLDDSKIQTLIQRKSRDIERDENIAISDPNDRRDLEAILTALHIATRLDRSESSAQSGRTSASYEQSMIDELKADARRLGATDELLGIGATDKRATISVPETKS